MKLFVGGAAIYSPRVADWQTFCDVVTTGRELDPASPPERYQPRRLPRNERRRATNIVRLSFRVLEQLAESFPFDASSTASVFASSGGDYDVVHRISRALAGHEKQISPTDFHNSVHNAPAGYWSIACGCHSPSTSLSAGDDTFPMGLVEAGLMAQGVDDPVLLVAYDIAPPPPLSLARPVAAPCAIALLLSRQPFTENLAMLDISVQGAPATNSQDEGAARDWSGVAAGNPIVRGMNLLEAICLTEASGQQQISYASTPLVVIDVSPVCLS